MSILATRDSRLNMLRFAEGLYSIAAALWAGGLWVVGYLVAPLLFSYLPDRALAGAMAGKLFTAMAWLGLGCGAYLAAFRLIREGGAALSQPGFWVIAAMLALLLAGHFGVQPLLAELKAQALPAHVMDSPLRGRFAFWHGVSSVLYLLQSLLAVFLVAGGRPGVN